VKKRGGRTGDGKVTLSWSTSGFTVDSAYTYHYEIFRSNYPQTKTSLMFLSPLASDVSIESLSYLDSGALQFAGQSKIVYYYLELIRVKNKTTSGGFWDTLFQAPSEIFSGPEVMALANEVKVDFSDSIPPPPEADSVALQADMNPNNTVALKWTVTGDNLNSNLHHFYIYKSTDKSTLNGTTPPTLTDFPFNKYKFSFNDGSVKPGKAYYYICKAFDEAGNVLAKSTVVSVDVHLQDIVLSVPTAVYGMVYGKVILNWTPPADTIHLSSYEIYRKPYGGKYEKIASVEVPTVTYTDTEAPSNTKLFYQCKAIYRTGTPIDFTSYIKSISNELQLTSKKLYVKLWVGSAIMSVNGVDKEIDPGSQSPITPRIKEPEGRLVLPIRAVIEAMGGSISYNESTEVITIALESDVIGIKIGDTSATINGVVTEDAMDVPPMIDEASGRTLVPLRFVVESLGRKAIWNGDDQSVTIEY